MTIDIDEEPILPTNGNIVTSRDHDAADDNIFAIALDKENSHPNIIETTGGRLSLQPQPLIGLNSLN